MGVYRRLVLLAEILFPAFFITKGWALEECAHALIQDTRCRGEAMDFLKKAREQYVVCRGEASPLVRRVDQAVAEWTSQERIVPSIFEENLQETEDENADLILAEGWCPVLLEVKTFESTEWAELADRIQAHWPDDSIVRWNKGYRLYDVGFSLQTLIMSCVIQESIDTKEQVAEDIQEAFEDEIQHVDLLLGQDYSY
jgi:translation elongation factor EF-1beta